MTTTDRPGDGVRMPPSRSPARLPMEYVLPVRWDHDRDLVGLTRYLRWLARRVDVTVVDGSPPELFAVHARRWSGRVRHLSPDPDLSYANGKVNGVTTGLRRARHERVIVADDDVRYDDVALAEMHRLVDLADLVRPQNYFHPLPWHACWDSSRSLLNRCWGGDYPGTFGLRRSTFQTMGGYDGGVLFENLELIRTVRVHGGVERLAHDLYVRRLPPQARHFWSQRVRQAYDDLAQPARLAVFLSVFPLTAWLVRHRRYGWLAGGLGAVVAAAEAGRYRAGGRRWFPVTASLLAPVWVLERALCSWLALGLRFGRGGVRYAGGRLRVAAHSSRALSRRVLTDPP